MNEVLESIKIVPLYPTVFHQHVFFNNLHYLYCKQRNSNSNICCILWHKNTTLIYICPSINPFYDPTSHSQPLVSYNFCLQTVLFCAVSCQLWHQRSLAAHSCTTSSHLKLRLHTGQLHARFFLGVYAWEEVFVHVEPTVVSKSIHASAETNFVILSVSTLFASCHRSIFCVYVTINSWTPGKACPIFNIIVSGSYLHLPHPLYGLNLHCTYATPIIHVYIKSWY